MRTLAAIAAALMILAGAMGIPGVLADAPGSPASPAVSNSSRTAPMALALDGHAYYPGGIVRINVHGATDPRVSVIDPDGVTHGIPMGRVNDTAFSGELALNTGIIPGSYTVSAIDNATGESATDTFDVRATPGNATTGGVFLYAKVSKTDYLPGDTVVINVATNAGTPAIAVTDPAGHVAGLNASPGGNDTFSAVYALDQAAIPGEYAVTATVDGNGSFEYSSAAFNVSAAGTKGGMRVRYAAYDPVQKAIVLRANVDAPSGEGIEDIVKKSPDVSGLAIKSIHPIPAGGDQGASGIQVEVLIPVNDSDRDSLSRRFNLSPHIADATTTVSASPNGTELYVSLNDKVDGNWYRLSASVPEGHTVTRITRPDGREIVNATGAGDSAGGAAKNEVGWYEDNGTLYFYDDPASTYTVSMATYPATITLYFHDNAGTCFLNTSPNNSSSDHTSLPGTGSGFVWTQSQALANDFTIRSSPAINLYVTGDSPSGNTIIDVQLAYVSGAATTRLGSVYGYKFQYAGNGPQLQSIPLSNVPVNATVPAGSKFVVTIDSHTGNNRIATVWESTAYPSSFSATSTSYVSVGNVSIYNASGNPIDNITPPSVVNVVANVTDPFGVQEVNNVTLMAYDANGTAVAGPLPMAMNDSTIPPSNAWAPFSCNLSIDASWNGNYTIVVAASSVDGSTANSSAALRVNSVEYGIDVTKSIAPAGNNGFNVTINVTNGNGNTLTNVYAYDFYAADFAVGGFSQPRTAAGVNNAMLQGNINVFGPFTIPPYRTITITYTARGIGDYRLANMTVVGVI